MKLEGILIGNEQTGLYFPFSDNDEDDYIIIKTTGLNDSTFSHHESDVKHIFSAKEDKEIGLSVAVKPALSELVESESSASTPFLPYSPIVTISVGPPEIGV